MAGADFDSVERSFFSTSAIDQQHQFEFFAEELCSWFSRREYKNNNSVAGFLAEIDTTKVGESQCLVLKGPACSITRSLSNIRADGDDSLFFNFVLNGELEFDGPGGPRFVLAGQTAVTDNSRTHHLNRRTDGGFCKSVSIRLPRAKYSSPKALERLADRWFLSQHKFAPLLKMSLRNLAGSIDKRIDAEIAALLKISESLIKSIAEDRRLDGVRNKNTILSAIEMEIEPRIADPDLSLSVISAALNVSSRHVQRAMASMDTTFSEYVRNKRLSMAMGRLRRPKTKSPSIEHISLECGFNDLSTFYRVFKSRYGCTPGDIRNDVANLERAGLAGAARSGRLKLRN